jgi:hypothetical protein
MVSILGGENARVLGSRQGHRHGGQDLAAGQDGARRARGPVHARRRPAGAVDFYRAKGFHWSRSRWTRAGPRPARAS